MDDDHIWEYRGVVVIEGPSRALRQRSPELLAQELNARLNDPPMVEQYRFDWRDLLSDLAPYHHCAHQLGLAPRRFFADAAAGAPPEIARYVRGFGSRRQIVDSEWHFAFTHDDDGEPLYLSEQLAEDVRAWRAKRREEERG